MLLRATPTVTHQERCSERHLRSQPHRVPPQRGPGAPTNLLGAWGLAQARYVQIFVSSTTIGICVINFANICPMPKAGTCQDLADDQFVCRSSPWRLKGSGLVMFSAVLPACFMENHHLVSVWYTESHSHYFRPVRSWWSSTACLSPEQKISLSRMTLLASHHPYLPQPRHCGPCGRVERRL